MSEALVGVIIGGLIASVAPACAIFLDTRRWKLERQLERLKEERSRLEQLPSDTLPQLAEAIAKGSYPSRLTSDILVLMPKNIGARPGDLGSDEVQEDELSAHWQVMRRSANKRLVPTRKSEALLLAAQPQRWAGGIR